MPCSIHQQRWRIYDPAMTVETAAEVVGQIDGKARDCLMLTPDAPAAPGHLAGAEPRNFINVPRHLPNVGR